MMAARLQNEMKERLNVNQLCNFGQGMRVKLKDGNQYRAVIVS